MDSLYEKINRWMPSKSDRHKYPDLILNFYSLFIGLDFSPFIEHFGSKIKNIRYNFVEGAITSGAVCFFGSLGMSLAQLGYINNIDELFTFASCYILTDHYLDDKEISLQDKVKTIQQINDFIDTVKPGDSLSNVRIDSEIIRLVADKYVYMITKIPGSEYHLKESFHSEVKTMYLQRQSNLDRNTYVEISEWKGGLFCHAIQSILCLPVTTAEYDLGACIQLLDDMIDIDDDIDLDINTIATHDYRTYGNLDKILKYLVDRIEKLDCKYNIFKPVLHLGITFAVHNNRDKYSSDMVQMIDEFVPFDSDTDKRGLMIWLRDKIQSY
jgi:hypothetical protein